MKAIVVEVKGAYAILMNQKGEFIKIKNNGHLRMGCEVNAPSPLHSRVSALSRFAPVAAVFMLVMFLGAGVYGYQLPYTYVDLDINPSVEITTNIFDRIIKVEGINEDGDKILASGNLLHKRLDEGVKALVDAAIQDGYLKEGTDNAILLTVAGRNQGKVQAIREKLESRVEDKLKEANIETNVMAEKSTLQRHQDAMEMDISPGKLNLIEKLVEVQPELENEKEKLKDLPVKDIMKSIQEQRKNEKETGRNSTEQTGKNTETTKQNGKTSGDNGDKNKKDTDKKDTDSTGKNGNSKDSRGQDSKDNETKQGEQDKGQQKPKTTGNISPNNNVKKNMSTEGGSFHGRRNSWGIDP